MNKKPGSLHHIEFYVNNLSQSMQFWSWFLSRFGYQLSKKWESGQSWMHSNGTYLVFVQVNEKWLATKNNRQGQGFNHMAFWSNPEDNLETLKDQLVAQNTKILLHDEKHICFEALDGIVAEVYLLSEPTN